MNIKITYLICILVLPSMFGCNDILDVNPKQSIDSSVALSSREGIEAALVSAYGRLQSYKQYGRDNLALAEALSDNAIHTENSAHLINEAANNRGYHLDNWQNGYYAINEVNLIIDALADSPYDASWTATVLGQAHFLRALFYHNLVRSYAYDPTAIVNERNHGGVPLMVVGVDDVSKITSLARPTIDAVYDQLYTDLDAATEYLSQGEQLTAPHRVTPAAVSALYSRIALYRGDYQRVVDKVDEALGETAATFSATGDFLGDWRKEVHPESIFEVKFNENENIGSDRSLRGTYTSRAFYDSESFTIQAVIAAAPDFYALYSNNDIRKQLFRLGVGNNASFQEIYKFISKNGVLNLDNVPVIRLSELYLNRAEAHYHLGTANYSGALADVNRIRERAGLSPTALTGEELLHEILLQRRLELAFEGHRWFDLKRNGQAVQKVSGDVPFDDYRILAPIPEREIQADGALQQNFGY